MGIASIIFFKRLGSRHVHKEGMNGIECILCKTDIQLILRENVANENLEKFTQMSNAPVLQYSYRSWKENACRLNNSWKHRLPKRLKDHYMSIIWTLLKYV